MSDFSWDGSDIVLEHQPKTAVYTNDRGQVVIRQEAGSLDPEDVWVYFDAANALGLCRAILRAAGHGDIEFIRNCGGGGYEDVELPELPSPRERRLVEEMKVARPDVDWDKASADFDKLTAKTEPKDPTAAERKRRQRERERDTRDATPLAPVTSVTSAVTSRPALNDSWLFNEEVKETAHAR
ncbi:hypothetical protein [Bradyrhizobium elkanii]|uniref:Uncharacterized protein n=1 Tax=Bradyrhizobium elkanii TaxID=29448 RepID=A0ABV4FI82_BRAEL|nr:hypothetical protein [Bradyrhizobium elkanii]MCP1754405.1 hypothetical protein [Bradyrhizobium elkanii]MCP1979925.1 hypothetical protein [Bradyrhizobium elkanii]MCS3885298.1 hypothetical protein [Bradyrhizobium elkanii]MCS4215676.1 hypothetical protein [Bradyrhizobium elkanii]MCW2188735.1 hypothetical protein [Bradyrhizobium elkanii]